MRTVLARSKILAAKLQALGCKRGHVVGILCENRLEYWVIMLAVLSTGATVACFNPLYSAGNYFVAVGEFFLLSGVGSLEFACLMRILEFFKFYSSCNYLACYLMWAIRGKKCKNLFFYLSQ